MRKLIAGSLAGSGLFLLMVVDTLLPGGPRIPMGVVVVPFALTFACFLGVMKAVNGSYFGQLPMAKFWPLLRALPAAVQVGAALLLVLTAANYFLSTTGVTDEADFQRGFAGNGVWISAGAAMLAYGAMRLERIPADARPAPSAWSVRWWTIGTMGVSAALAAAVLLLPQVHDTREVHEELRTRFEARGWVSHLVAADTSHNSFRVYLDSADPALQAEACTSLRVYGTDLGRTAELYLFDGVHKASRLRSC
jgi:hypothetical protein